jgi:hypothetical protein
MTWSSDFGSVERDTLHCLPPGTNHRRKQAACPIPYCVPAMLQSDIQTYFMKLMLETSYSLQQESANMFDTPRSCEHVLVSMKCALCRTLPSCYLAQMIFPERSKAPTCAWLSFPFHSVGPTLTVFVIGASTIAEEQFNLRSGNWLKRRRS